jgi:hypothetical protein
MADDGNGGFLGYLGCVAGLHDWSDWIATDPDHPGDQYKACRRCSKVKTNAAPAPIKAWKMPLK